MLSDDSESMKLLSSSKQALTNLVVSGFLRLLYWTWGLRQPDFSMCFRSELRLALSETTVVDMEIRSHV